MRDVADQRAERLASRDPRAGTWVFDFTPLCHPLWWVARGLLLVNDNLLKGAGIVP
jgi:hypothetical protein